MYLMMKEDLFHHKMTLPSPPHAGNHAQAGKNNGRMVQWNKRRLRCLWFSLLPRHDYPVGCVEWDVCGLEWGTHATGRASQQLENGDMESITVNKC